MAVYVKSRQEGLVKVTRSAQCKNSPKNAFVEDFVIDLIAGARIEGKVADGASLPVVPDDVSAVEIVNAISHGKVGAANGSMTVNGVRRPFAAFVQFTTNKATQVKSLTLYSTTFA